MSHCRQKRPTIRQKRPNTTQLLGVPITRQGLCASLVSLVGALGYRQFSLVGGLGYSQLSGLFRLRTWYECPSHVMTGSLIRLIVIGPGLGFRVWDLGVRVQGLGSKVKGDIYIYIL